MRRLGAAAALGSASILAACSFFLDFEELQQGGGSAGDGGPGDGSTACDADEDCDDGDDCTEDVCDLGSSTCQKQARALVRDGFSQTLAVERAFRVTLTSGAGHFYLASYAQPTKTTSASIAFYAFDRDGTELRAGPTTKDVEELGTLVPLGPAGLVADVTSGFKLRALVAVGDSVVDDTGKVWDIAFDEQLGPNPTVTAASADDNYAAVSRQQGPVAWHVEGDAVYAGWPGPTGGLYVYDGQQLPAAAPPVLANGETVRAFAPFGYLGQPGMFWISDQIRFQIVGGPNPGTLIPCLPLGDTMLAATTAVMNVGQVWYVVWSKQSGVTYSTERNVIGCNDPGGTGPLCSAGLPDATCAAAKTGERNPSAAFVRLDADPDGVYQVFASSRVELGKAAVTLLLARSEPGSDAGAATILDSRDLSEQPLGANGAGPDWPAVALSGQDRLAVAWTEPGPTADQVRVERFRVCYPANP